MVQSGGTLYECMKLLKQEGFTEINAFVTHAVFPNQGYLEFLPGGTKEGFSRFFVSDTNPEVTKNLPRTFFVVLTIANDLVDKICEIIDEPVIKKDIHVHIASDSEVKTFAVRRAYELTYPSHVLNIKADKCESEINPQPVGMDEIIKGIDNRISNYFKQNKGTTGVIIGIESGIIRKNQSYCDITFIKIFNIDMKQCDLFCTSPVEFDEKYFLQSKETNYQTTVGQLIDPNNSTDWYKTTGLSNRSRHDMITEAIMAFLQNHN